MLKQKRQMTVVDLWCVANDCTLYIYRGCVRLREIYPYWQYSIAVEEVPYGDNIVKRVIAESYKELNVYIGGEQK